MKKKNQTMSSAIWLWLVTSVVGQYKTVDRGPGLRTGYKTLTRYKTRTEGCGPKCRLDI